MGGRGNRNSNNCNVHVTTVQWYKMIKKINAKLESLSTTKQVMLISCLILILMALAFFAMQDSIGTITYKDVQGNVVCTERYVNGQIDGNYCPQNSRHIQYKIDAWATAQGIYNVTN